MNFLFDAALIAFDDFVIWRPILILAYLAVIILAANIIRTKIPLVKKSLLPTAVIAGFLVLILKITGFNELLSFESAGERVTLFGDSNDFLEAVTFHAAAIGFIALALKRMTDKEREQKKKGGGALKAGSLIVSTYLLQGAIGMAATVAGAYILRARGSIADAMLPVYGASGILLPMGYGQGPAQANNIGVIYEGMGLNGGKSFGIGIASLGFVWACVVGVIYMNILLRRGKIKLASEDEKRRGGAEDLADGDEIPESESMDKLTVQIGLVLVVYLVTYLFSYFVTKLIGLMNFLGNNQQTLSMMIWGFNFLFGTIFAIIAKNIMAALRKKKVMKREYVNNYIMNRISGLAFDFMIVASIGSVEISGIADNLVVFLIITTAGGVATFFFLQKVCAKMYPGYKYEATLAMYGMLTGTISTGVVLLREIDPEFKTPASSDLVYGSATAVMFGLPIMLAIAPAAKSVAGLFITFAATVIYGAALTLFSIKFRSKKGVTENLQGSEEV